MSHALVLNASFEPIHIISWQRAMTLLFQGKVEVLEDSDHEVRTVQFTFKVPAVLRLLEYAPINKKKPLVRFSRLNIFSRDKNICQYCGKGFHRNLLTLDHVVPVVQGGKKIWDNIVTSCKPCNQKKGGRTPIQAGMKLLKKPMIPQWLPISSVTLGVSNIDEKWRIYLKIDREEP